MKFRFLHQFTRLPSTDPKLPERFSFASAAKAPLFAYGYGAATVRDTENPADAALAAESTAQHNDALPTSLKRRMRVKNPHRDIVRKQPTA